MMEHEPRCPARTGELDICTCGLVSRWAQASRDAAFGAASLAAEMRRRPERIGDETEVFIEGAANALVP
jgi:hypothetical protein